MLIELQPPFSGTWTKGYVISNSENRKYVCLVNSLDGRTTISYARYLMCVHLGYTLSPDLEVDHIDDDKSNDAITNLQILTKEQNLLKQHYNYVMNKQVSYGYCSAHCNIHFILTEREVKMRVAQNVQYAFCSRSCAARRKSF